MSARFAVVRRINRPFRSGLRRRSALVVAVAGAAVLAISVGPSFGDSDPATFDPTITFETSTTRATAHPDARITIDNTGNTASIGSIKLSLPDGFYGSLAAPQAVDKCSFQAGQPGTPGEPDVPGLGSDNCTAANKIGSVTATATIDKSTATITGDVFLTEPISPANAAGLGFSIRAKVGGVDLGTVRVAGDASIRNNGEGIDTLVEEIPSSITDIHGRTVAFHLDRMVVDLISTVDGTETPLLTNPSTCGTASVDAEFSPQQHLEDVPADKFPASVPYTVTGCDTTTFGPSAFNFTNTDQTPGQPTGFSTQIDFPADSASIDNLTVRLPSELSVNFPSLGVSADMCSDEAAPTFTSTFDPAQCPQQAIVGFVLLRTPLLENEVGGFVYLIDKSPIPWIGIDISPSYPGNPPGVTLRLLGTSSTPFSDPTCTVEGSCQRNIQIQFQNLPDATVSSIYMEVNGPDRPGVDASLSGKILKISDSTSCQPSDEVLADFASNSTISDASATQKTSGRVSTVSVTGCSADPVGISGPVGDITSDTTPTFGISPGSAAGPNFFCAIDHFSAVSPGTACSTTFTPASPLNPGTHRVYAGTFSSQSSPFTVRGFAVEPDPVTPGPAPVTSFSTTPPTTTGIAPSFDFQSSQSGVFQCSIDDGAFLPCGSQAPASTPSSFTVADADAFFPGSDHKFAVRAQNAEGTVDVTPVTTTFHVSVPFDPTFDFTSTTNVARSHPDLDVVITSPSEEKLKDTTIKLPDGFFGGLQGVQAICAVADADAGSCTAASQVGTIETEATVDGSRTVVRIDGKVYLTEARVPGDAAGLSIAVDAKLQEVDLGKIIVPARLTVRGQAKGIDSLVVDIPKSITPTNGFDQLTDFTLRKLTLKLRTGAGAAQPLLTNPSSCVTSDFHADFTGYGLGIGSELGTASVTRPYAIAGCEALGFAPTLSASIIRPDGHAPTATPYQGVSLSANLIANPDQAGIKAASILLPKPLTIDLAKLPLTICEQGQYETNTCPAASIIGNAVATSPLLPPGETLSGPVYILRAVPPRAIPRLFVRLNGRINLSIVAMNSFENGSQIRTDFTDLPDAPLNSFSMNVSSLLTTTRSPCQDAVNVGSSMTGTLTGHNGKTAAVDSPFNFDCSGTYVSQKFKKKGKKSTLRLKFDNRGSQPKTKKLTLKFGKWLSINKRGIKKKLTISVDGKKLKSKCFKYKSAAVLEVNLCGKKGKLVDLNFKAGSLTAAKKLRSPRVTATLVSADNKKLALPLSLKKPVPQFVLPFVPK